MTTSRRAAVRSSARCISSQHGGPALARRLLLCPGVPHRSWTARQRVARRAQLRGDRAHPGRDGRRALVGRGSSSTSARTRSSATRLAGIASGQAGGPMAAVGPLVERMLGVEARPITYTKDRMKRSLSIPGVLEQSLEGMPSPVKGRASLRRQYRPSRQCPPALARKLRAAA